MDAVKVGVIGCGVIGSRNLQDAMACPNMEVVAAADLRESRREWARQQGIPRIYEDGRDLIDSDPDVEAVIIAFPAGTRTAMGLRALAAGKHVLTEKPVAMNAREVASLGAAAEAAGLVFGCLSVRFRLCESAARATELVRSGALGPLRHLRVRALLPGGPANDRVPPPWRESCCMNGGGILTNWGCYDLDYILGICGWSFRPRTVLAQTWPCVPQFRGHVAPESDAEAYFTALVLGENGMVLSLERGEFMPASRDLTWQIIGTNGSLNLHMLNTEDKRLVHDHSSTAGGVTSTVIWEGKDPDPSGNSLALDNFAKAVRQGTPVATGTRQALVMMQITDAIYQSARSGQAVTIP